MLILLNNGTSFLTSTTIRGNSLQLTSTCLLTTQNALISVIKSQSDAILLCILTLIAGVRFGGYFLMRKKCDGFKRQKVSLNLFYWPGWSINFLTVFFCAAILPSVAVWFSTKVSFLGLDCCTLVRIEGTDLRALPMWDTTTQPNLCISQLNF